MQAIFYTKNITVLYGKSIGSFMYEKSGTFFLQNIIQNFSVHTVNFIEKNDIQQSFYT